MAIRTSTDFLYPNHSFSQRFVKGVDLLKNNLKNFYYL